MQSRIEILKWVHQNYAEYYHRMPRCTINEHKVPKSLQALIPLVELWGVNREDDDRIEIARAAPLAARSHLVKVFDEYDDILMFWLAKDWEREDDSGIDEYACFDAAYMSYDWIREQE